MKKLRGYDGIDQYKYTWVDWAGVIGLGLVVILIPLALVLSADAKEEYPEITSIYWSDGDSGIINGDFKFRIANYDAPETGGIGAYGGAKCEAERKLGYNAKAFIVNFTKGKELKIERNYVYSTRGRAVIDLSANGANVALAGKLIGHLRHWPHKRRKALKPKPNWCE